MTTLLPFTSYYSKKVLNIGESLLYPDDSQLKTWTSADGVTWSSANWVGPYYPTGQVAYFNGYVWWWDTESEPGVLTTLKSADFINWALEANQEAPINFIWSDMVVVQGGMLRRFNKASTYVKTYSTTNGTAWSSVVDTSLLSASVARIVLYAGSLYAIPPGKSTVYKSVYRSDDGGLTWTQLTSNWGVPTVTLIDCIATSDGLLAVFSDNETWTSSDGITWIKKNYTLPTGINVMRNGALISLGSDLFMICCGTSYRNIFKLVTNSGPVGAPL